MTIARPVASWIDLALEYLMAVWNEVGADKSNGSSPNIRACCAIPPVVLQAIVATMKLNVVSQTAGDKNSLWFHREAGSDTGCGGEEARGIRLGFLNLSSNFKACSCQ